MHALVARSDSPGAGGRRLASQNARRIEAGRVRSRGLRGRFSSRPAGRAATPGWTADPAGI